MHPIFRHPLAFPAGSSSSLCEIRSADPVNLAAPVCAMGSGASTPADVVKEAGKMEHKDLKDILGLLADEEWSKSGQAKMNTRALGKLSDEDNEKLKKVLNLAGKPGSNMRRAVWLWTEDNCAEALGENELEGEIPKCTGKQLVMDEVKFEKEDDKKKVDTMIKRVMQMFMEDQAQADVPYIPPESAKKRAVWLWDKDAVKEFLSEVEIDVEMKDGKELLTDGRNKFKDGQDEKVQEVLGSIGLMLMQDIVMA
ncbi:unnamed protein product [Durusdinium trenchii]|uniref:Uncharacterized protein n=2 Tax=Durusdinium trenchii TaxID=1381693 RepID=A0ABP0LVV6_9DINO